MLAQSRQPTVGYCYRASVAVCIGQVLGRRWRPLSTVQIYRVSAETWPNISPIPSRLSLLPKNKCWRPKFGPEMAAKCIPELSFQQRHDIGNRSTVTFLPMLGQYWAVSIFALGRFLRNFFISKKS